MKPASIWRIGQLGFTVALVALLWSATDGPEIIRILADAQPVWLLAAVVALMCQTLLSAVRWKITAAVLGQFLTMPYVIKEYFTSQVVNQALPGAVVGDAARAFRARTQAGIAISSQAVLLERLAGQIAMFITMACAFLITAFVDGGLDWPAAFAGPIGLAIGIGVFLIFMIVCAKWFSGLIGARFSRTLRPLYLALISKQVLPAQIGLGAAITLCNLAAFGFCAWAVGVALPVAAILAIVPVILFSMLIPFTVSGWGVREGSAALLLPLAGTSPSEGVAASVMFGCALLLAVLPGLIALVLK